MRRHIEVDTLGLVERFFLWKLGPSVLMAGRRAHYGSAKAAQDGNNVWKPKSYDVSDYYCGTCWWNFLSKQRSDDMTKEAISE